MLQNFTQIRRNEKKKNVYSLEFQFIFLLKLYLLCIILKIIFFFPTPSSRLKNFS